MNAALRLEPGRSYKLAEAAEVLDVTVVALQARLRRAERRGAHRGHRVVEVTPWISAFRICNGREWRFCARERASPRDDEGD